MGKPKAMQTIETAASRGEKIRCIVETSRGAVSFAAYLTECSTEEPFSVSLASTGVIAEVASENYYDGPTRIEGLSVTTGSVVCAKCGGSATFREDGPFVSCPCGNITAGTFDGRLVAYQNSGNTLNVASRQGS